MLLSLDINNVALISRLKLEFEKGLNILSGETGAGKTIILESLMFALGSKSDKGLIRSGQNFMSVEAVFDIAGDGYMLSYLKDMGIEDDVMIICRTLSADGKNTIKLNGRTITLSMLREISSRLVDIYSQSEHISLLKPSTHIRLLDGYGLAGENIKEEIENCYNEYKKVLEQLNNSDASPENERLAELYAFAIEEIEKAAVSEREETELSQKREKFLNIEKISNALGEALSMFKGEYGLNGIATKIKSSLYQCQKYDEQIQDIASRFESAYLEMDDIYSSLTDYIYSLEYDEAEARQIEQRLDEIKAVKRKYGGTISKVEEYLNEIKLKLNQIESGRENARILNEKKNRLLDRLYELSVNISEKRKNAANNFEQTLMNILNDLSMTGCMFKVMFEELPKREDIENHITKNGLDKVEFYISTNKGEPLRPLAKIISGGEMSRFMLAIKSIICNIDDIDTLIFDEIDSGISGVTATAVAKKFASISAKRQIIAITHLPQIAAMADVNFLIEKKEEGGSVNTKITRLSEQGAQTEVARLIGAADIGDYGKMHAKEMIEWSQNIKKQLRCG